MDPAPANSFIPAPSSNPARARTAPLLGNGASPDQLVPSQRAIRSPGPPCEVKNGPPTYSAVPVPSSKIVQHATLPTMPGPGTFQDDPFQRAMPPTLTELMFRVPMA